MYSIFCKLSNGQLKFLASVPGAAQSYFLCKMFSMKGTLPVLAVVNFNDGTTEQCCQFEKGRLVWHSPKCDPVVGVCCPDGERESDLDQAAQDEISPDIGSSWPEKPEQPGPRQRS